MLERDIFNSKPDSLSQDMPANDDTHLDILCLVNSSEEMFIRICDLGIYHLNIHGWVHRKLPDLSFQQWRERLNELREKYDN